MNLRDILVNLETLQAPPLHLPFRYDTGKYRMTPSGRNINLHPLLFVGVSSIFGKRASS